MTIEGERLIGDEFKHVFTWDKLGFLSETAMMRVVDLSSLVEQAKEVISCVGRTLASFALTAALAFCASSASASEPLVRRMSIIEHGIHVSETTGAAAAVGTLGVVQRVRAPRLVENTTLIPGRRSARFGVRYLVRARKLASRSSASTALMVHLPIVEGSVHRLSR